MLVEKMLPVKKKKEKILPVSQIADRISQYVVDQGLTIENFSAEIGYSKSTIGKARKNSRPLGSDVVEKFLRRFPDANPYWLIFGEGEKNVNRNTSLQDGIDELRHVWLNLLQSKEDTIQSKDDTIRKMERWLLDKDARIKDKEEIIQLLKSP